LAGSAGSRWVQIFTVIMADSSVISSELAEEGALTGPSTGAFAKVTGLARRSKLMMGLSIRARPAI